MDGRLAAAALVLILPSGMTTSLMLPVRQETQVKAAAAWALFTLLALRARCAVLCFIPDAINP